MGFTFNRTRVSSWGRQFAGNTAGVHFTTLGMFNRGKLLHFSKLISIPNGTRHPHSYLMAQQSGGLASYGYLSGDGQIPIPNLAGGVNKSSSISGSGNISNASLDLVIWAAASILANSTMTSSVSGSVNLGSSINGAGAITNALPFVVADIAASILSGGIMSGPDLTTALNIYATINGSSSWDNADISLLGALASVIICSSSVNPNGSPALNLNASIDGLSNMSNADLRAIADLAISILGVSLVSNTNSPSIGHLDADITPFTELSPQTLSKAVWDQLAVDNNTPATMGYVLNNVSTGGVSPSDIADAVWAALKVNSSDPDSMGELMFEINNEVMKRLKKTDFIALK